jgi:hypothetical protein
VSAEDGDEDQDGRQGGDNAASSQVCATRDILLRHMHWLLNQ